MTTTPSPLLATRSSSLQMLASLLRLPPEMMVGGTTTREMPAQWLAEQKQVVDSGVLPFEVLAKPTTTAREVSSSSRWRRVVAPFLLTGSRQRGLCQAHGGLDYDLVREVYGLVRKEVVDGGEGVRSWLRFISRRREEYKRDDWRDVRGFVEDMAAVVVLMEGFEMGDGVDEERWEGYFGRGVRMEDVKERFGTGWERVGSGCLACVLGVIGGRKEVVVGLRGSCLSRAKRRTPRLEGRWLGGWMDGEMVRESEVLAGRLRVVRRLQEGRSGGEGVGMDFVRGVEEVRLADDAGHRAGGNAIYEGEGSRQLSTNNPYRPTDPKSPSPPVPPPQEPFGGFDGAFDSDDDHYQQILNTLVPPGNHIQNPIPPPTPPSMSDSRDYHPPRQSWTAPIPPLSIPRRCPPPHHSHAPANLNPQVHTAIIPPPSSSYYADEILNHYQDYQDHKPSARTRSSTIFSGRPRPEEYDSLVTMDNNEAALLCRREHQKRLDECYSEKSTKARLKRGLERGRSSPGSDGGRTEWGDFCRF